MPQSSVAARSVSAGTVALPDSRVVAVGGAYAEVGTVSVSRPEATAHGDARRRVVGGNCSGQCAPAKVIVATPATITAAPVTRNPRAASPSSSAPPTTPATMLN